MQRHRGGPCPWNGSGFESGREQARDHHQEEGRLVSRVKTLYLTRHALLSLSGSTLRIVRTQRSAIGQNSSIMLRT